MLRSEVSNGSGVDNSSSVIIKAVIVVARIFDNNTINVRTVHTTGR